MNATPLSRRDLLAGALAVGGSMLGKSVRAAGWFSSEDLVLNTRGGYHFLPAVPFLSFAARAADGFEIVRATFRRLRPFSEGVADIERLLRASSRPIHALCGIELRSPAQVSGAEFGAFNRIYLERMARAGLLIADRVPIARTNVAEVGVREHSIHAFSYTMPVVRRRQAPSDTFVLSAVPEVRDITAERFEFVAAGDTTPTGLRLKIEFVLSKLDNTMQVLGAQWAGATGVQLYTVHDVQPLLADVILPRVGGVGRRGIEWHHASPPVVGNELEIDVRGTRMELVADV
jgi:hypothetical protein